jgi:quercetin dioxygenase-like cupin family protein
MKYILKKEFKKNNMFGTGIPNFMMAKYFTGRTYLKPLASPRKTNLFPSNVTFEPGARTQWHIHHADEGGGQILVCTAGEGWYQEEGKKPVSLKPGMVINIPPEVIHWHGAKKDSWFSHIAIAVPGENPKNKWIRPVTDEEYGKLE